MGLCECASRWRILRRTLFKRRWGRRGMGGGGFTWKGGGGMGDMGLVRI